MIARIVKLPIMQFARTNQQWVLRLKPNIAQYTTDAEMLCGDAGAGGIDDPCKAVKCIIRYRAQEGSVLNEMGS